MSNSILILAPRYTERERRQVRDDFSSQLRAQLPNNNVEYTLCDTKVVQIEDSQFSNLFHTLIDKNLGGGFNLFFSPPLGEMIQFD